MYTLNMDNVGVAFEVLEEDQTIPVGLIESSGHLVACCCLWSARGRSRYTSRFDIILMAPCVVLSLFMISMVLLYLWYILYSTFAVPLQDNV